MTEPRRIAGPDQTARELAVRRWLVFVAVFVSCLAVVAALGVSRYNQVTVIPRAVLTPTSGPVEEAGIRFSYVSFGTYPEVVASDFTRHAPPAGFTWVRVEIDQEFLRDTDPEDPTSCSLELLTAAGSWEPHDDAADWTGGKQSCLAYEEVRRAGERSRMTAWWLVPTTALTDARVKVVFPGLIASAFEVHP